MEWWENGHSIVLRYGLVNLSTFQLFNPSTLQLFNPSTLQPFNPSTLQLFNSSTLQLFNSTSSFSYGILINLCTCRDILHFWFFLT